MEEKQPSRPCCSKKLKLAGEESTDSSAEEDIDNPIVAEKIENIQKRA